MTPISLFIHYLTDLIEKLLNDFNAYIINIVIVVDRKTVKIIKKITHTHICMHACTHKVTKMDIQRLQSYYELIN